MVELKPTNLHTIWVSYLIQSILFINPVAMGSGMTILRDLNEIQRFTPVKSITFDCGIVVLHYGPERT